MWRHRQSTRKRCTTPVTARSWSPAGSSAAGRSFGQGCCEVAAALDRRLHWGADTLLLGLGVRCCATRHLASPFGLRRSLGSRPLARRKYVHFSPRLRPRDIASFVSPMSSLDCKSAMNARSCPERTRSARLRSSGLQYLRDLASPPLIRQCKSFRARCFGSLASCSLLPPRLLALVPGAPRGLGWANLAEGRLRLDRLPATAAGRLSSPAGPPRERSGDPGDGIPCGRQESLRPAVLRCAAALRLRLGCGSIALGRSIAIAVAMGAARREAGD